MDIDMFPEELTSGLQEENGRLKIELLKKTNDCVKLNKIYKRAWDIAAIVCGDGGMTLEADDKLFMRLYDAMSDYDDNKDLRDRY